MQVPAINLEKGGLTSSTSSSTPSASSSPRLSLASSSSSPSSPYNPALSNSGEVKSGPTPRNGENHDPGVDGTTATAGSAPQPFVVKSVKKFKPPKKGKQPAYSGSSSSPPSGAKSASNSPTASTNSASLATSGSNGSGDEGWDGPGEGELKLYFGKGWKIKVIRTKGNYYWGELINTGSSRASTYAALYSSSGWFPKELVEVVGPCATAQGAAASPTSPRRQMLLKRSRSRDKEDKDKDKTKEKDKKDKNKDKNKDKDSHKDSQKDSSSEDEETARAAVPQRSPSPPPGSTSPETSTKGGAAQSPMRSSLVKSFLPVTGTAGNSIATTTANLASTSSATKQQQQQSGAGVEREIIKPSEMNSKQNADVVKALQDVATSPTRRGTATSHRQTKSMDQITVPEAISKKEIDKKIKQLEKAERKEQKKLEKQLKKSKGALASTSPPSAMGSLASKMIATPPSKKGKKDKGGNGQLGLIIAAELQGKVQRVGPWDDGEASKQPADEAGSAGLRPLDPLMVEFVLPPDLVKQKLEAVPTLGYIPLVDNNNSGRKLKTTSAKAGEENAYIIEGPDQNESEEMIVEEGENGRIKCLVSGRTVSTYPRMLSIPGARLGDPICDCFAVRMYSNGLSFCVCDGCGWGRLASEAARTSLQTFMREMHSNPDFVQKELPPHLAAIASSSSSPTGRPASQPSGAVRNSPFLRGGPAPKEVRKSYIGGQALRLSNESRKTTRDLAHSLLQTLAKAHNDISLGKETWNCGTTTVVAGVLVELNPADVPEGNGKRKHGLVMVSVGDCKVYHFSQREQEFKDITYGNRQNLLNATDCGGRIGPTLGEDQRLPDLRNLKCHFYTCEEGDLLWVCSDGVHDNVDPQMLGLYPKEVDAKLSETDWAALDSELTAKLKNSFSMSVLKQSLLSATKEGASSVISQLPSAKAAAQEQMSSSTMFFTELSKGAERMSRLLGSSPLSETGAGSSEAQQIETTTTDSLSPAADNTDNTSEKEAPNGGEAIEDISSKKEGLESEGELEEDEDEEEDDEGLGPRRITRRMIKHCLGVTQPTRQFMEANPNKRQPVDYRLFPGKLDHTTCLSFRV